MLALKDISKNYGKQTVLSGLNLEIPQERVISIMGKSGSGKSTLLGIMAGLVRPDSGKVFYGEEDLTDLDEESLATFRLLHTGIIFQDFKLISSLTVYDNVLLGIYPRRDIERHEKDRRISELLDEVGLSGKLSEKVDNLSGGERQRVAIARSLVNRPDIVLADEPTGNLDSKTAESIMELFSKLHGNHSTTFVIVTHDKDIAEKTERIYYLKDGGLEI